MQQPITIMRTVDELMALFDAGHSDAEPGEPAGFSLTDHGLQCAYELSRVRPDDHELQVAGLLHDIGHQLAPGDDAGHGRAGADAVRDLLGERVALLIEHHVPAKRYLVTTDPDYRDMLSSVSAQTLLRQGGAMTEHEQEAFEAQPEWRDGLVLRRADEAAKVPGRDVPPSSHWRLVIDGLTARQASI